MEPEHRLVARSLERAWEQAPAIDANISLSVDASATAVGAVLHQYINNTLQPLAFFSKKLQKSETRYSTYDRELLGIYLAVKHFKYHLEWRDFYINTDHKPIIYEFQQKPENSSLRQLRHLLYIAQFTTDIRQKTWCRK